MNFSCKHLFYRCIDLWNYIWFQDKNTIPMEVVRIGIGFLLFFNYGLLMPQDVIALYGDSGLFSRAVVPELNQFGTYSVFIFFEQSWQLLLFHYIFVFWCLCFCVGWQTSWVKWLVLIGHYSYFHRNPLAGYGVDIVLLALLPIMCLAPIGKAISFDRIRTVKKYKNKYGLDTRPPVYTSRIGFACQRLLQVQMAVIYFIAGVDKLYGIPWLIGQAPWLAMVNNETAFFPLGIFADHFWIINLIAYGTIVIEIAYPFWIWGKSTRPYMLLAALSLHIGIAIVLGMYYFAAVMMAGHLIFMRRGWYSLAGQWWKKRNGKMEMIYDGDCGFCKRSMALFLAFDGLKQISTRDFRTQPSTLVTEEQANKALYLVVENKIILSGFDAYRYVVARVPGMWWFALLYFIPLFSKLIGSRVYGWTASHRMLLSKIIRQNKSTDESVIRVTNADS